MQETAQDSRWNEATEPKPWTVVFHKTRVDSYQDLLSRISGDFVLGSRVTHDYFGAFPDFLYTSYMVSRIRAKCNNATGGQEARRCPRPWPPDHLRRLGPRSFGGGGQQQVGQGGGQGGAGPGAPQAAAIARLGGGACVPGLRPVAQRTWARGGDRRQHTHTQTR